jgi:hypothetical protein
MFPTEVVGEITSAAGVAKNIVLGFVPDRVTMVNRVSGRAVSWYRKQGDLKGIVSGPGVTTALLTTTGPSALTGAAAAAAGGEGFILGTDAINNGTDKIDFQASRNGPGEADSF